MLKSDVLNSRQALAYLTDCTLATVADLRMRKSSSKSEIGRQIGMAQFGIEWCIAEGIDYSLTRIKEVVEKYNGSVSEWAQQFKP